MAIACTIVARNYLPHARVLAESFTHHHPDVPFVVLVVDDETQQVDLSGELFTALRLAEIGLPRQEIAILAAIYDVTELSTAVKPWLLKYLRAEGHDVAVYLDPDIKVYAPLTEAITLAAGDGVVLTPHTMVPFPEDQYRLETADLLAAGAFNLGFIAVGPLADPFLDWWWSRTRRHAVSDPARQMFTDQRSIDLVPCLYAHDILKDPSYNVAYWNLHGRTLERAGDGYTVDGRPLTFFHFSGFDHRKPHLLSKHQGDRPRVLLSDRPVLAELCREYAADLVRHGIDAPDPLPYGWARFGDGHELTGKCRRLYRDAVIEAEVQGLPVPPGPFTDASADPFIAWLRAPVGHGPRPRLPRLLEWIHRQRIDLQRHFPDPEGADLVAYLEWIRHDGVVQERLPIALLPTDADMAAAREPWATPPDAVQPGLNIVGYLRAELGVGEAGRLLAAAAGHAGIPHEAIAYCDTRSRQEHRFDTARRVRAAFDINVMCVNADATPGCARAFGPELFDGRVTAGLWFWEVEQFPESYAYSFTFVDEVWAASEFVAEALRRVSPKPVRHVRLPVSAPVIRQPRTREELGLPDGPLFLFVFDYLSVVERKNAVGLARAFRMAFAPGEGPTLVIKTINGDLRRVDRERLLHAVAGRPDIRVIDDYWSANDKTALLALCDCYVSLHRSEGLGLTMAEAMTLGRPVIATGYSGNLDFMTAENSYLVRHDMVPIVRGVEPYPADGVWAEPDLEQAAHLMRHVVTAPDEARRRGERGQADIQRTHGLDVCGRALAKVIEDVRMAHKPEDAAAPAEVLAPDPVARLLDEIRATLPPAALLGGGMRTFGRRLLYRLLRPYWWPQRHIDELLLEAIDHLNRRSAHAPALVDSDAAGQRAERSRHATD